MSGLQKTFSFLLVLSIFACEALNSTIISNESGIEGFNPKNCLWRFKTDEVLDNFHILTADCSRLGICIFPSNYYFQTTQEIDLSHNRIQKLDFLESRFDSDKLLSLKLSFNAIATISPTFFENIPNLKVLDLSDNVLQNFPNSNIFRGLKNLTSLDLSHNHLSTLPSDIFWETPRLRHLDLSWNFLGQLMQSANDLFDLKIKIPISLESLRLNGLEMQKLHARYFERADNLTHLSLTDNDFKKVPIGPYRLKYLDLSGNPFDRIAAGNFDYHYLEVLKLSRSYNLLKVDAYAFYNLETLNELHVNDCPKLISFNDTAFGSLIDGDGTAELKLKKIYLQKNSLKSLNSTLLSLFIKLDTVDLQNNPWRCDCKILWLQKLKGLLRKDYNVRCNSPYSLRNKSVMELSLDQVMCVTKNTKTQKVIITIMCALIILLIILIVYLVYLGPFYASNKYRGIGPQSPYHNNMIGIIPIRAENL